MFDWILGAVFVAMSVVAIVQLVLNWGVDDEDEGDSQDKPTNAENPNRRGDAVSDPR
jgi:hypothetical protein